MANRLRISWKGSAWPALFCLMVTGCRGCQSADGDAYPEQLKYPPRIDWIVDQLPTQAPAGVEPAGDMDKPIQLLNTLGGKAYDPSTIPEATRQEIQTALAIHFGTPNQPFIEPNSGLGISPEQLQAGSKLFRRHCLQCHGLLGDGRGPTGAFISPHPRDFRTAVFKFVSTKGTGPRKPCRNDLRKILANGIPTTAMPSFGMLPEQDRERLLDYVTYLSLRGKVEFTLMRNLLKGGQAAEEIDIPTDSLELVKQEATAWQKADADVIAINPPKFADDSPEMADSIRRGRNLFLDAKGAGCVTCHADYGRQGKAQYDIWGFAIAPANLTEHKRKGGTTREDFYRRIHGGIGPSNMPAAVSLTEPQLWDLAHFLKSLPNPSLLPDDLKNEIYPR